MPTRLPKPNIMMILSLGLLFQFGMASLEHFLCPSSVVNAEAMV